MAATTTRELYDKVNEHYSALALYDKVPASGENGLVKAKSGSDGTTPVSGDVIDNEKEKDSEHVTRVALSFGYSANELADLPDGANLGVSCGNPLAVAGLKTGETVVDLGSGAGFDVFLAAKKVGATGMAIGVDMSKEMLARARGNATKSSILNVKFVESPIISINLPSSSADCIISNCVINLVPRDDKHLVFEEIFRLLKPGGRVAISDILGKKEMPPDMQEDMSLYVGCISGAETVTAYANWLKEAGFKDILIVDKKNDLNIYKEDTRILENEPEKLDAACCTSNGAPTSCGSEMTSTQSQGSSSACCSADNATEASAVSCCAPTKASAPSTTAKKLNRGCCSTIEQVGDHVTSKVADVDFNEWVGSFSVYAVKPSKDQHE